MFSLNVKPLSFAIWNVISKNVQVKDFSSFFPATKYPIKRDDFLLWNDILTYNKLFFQSNYCDDKYLIIRSSHRKIWPEVANGNSQENKYANL